MRLSTGKSKKHEARTYLNQLIAEGNLIPDKKKNMTFTEFSKDFWLWDKCQYVERKREREGITQDYASNQRNNLEKHILPFFGPRKLIHISGDDIFTWLSTFKGKNLSNKTANNNLNTLKVMLTEAVKKGHIKGNPAKDVTPLRKNTKERGILSPPEVKKIFSPDTIGEVWENDLFNYLGNLLSAVSGLRQGEILALKTKNVFPEYIHVEHSFSKVDSLKSTKTGDKRDIPISPHVYSLLENIMKPDPESYIFSFNGVRPIEGRILTSGLYTALKNIEISEEDIKERNIKFHSWRHFFNTTLRKNGLADSKIQRITGHKTQEMTENYTHWQVEDLREVVRIQDGIILET